MTAASATPSSELAAALRRAGLDEVDDSARRRAEYSTDASLYRVVPSVVAFPRAVDEVVAAVEVCRTLGVPLTARGAGTSIAGNAVGTGLILDFSRHLNAVSVDPSTRTATVEPGLVLADLQKAARPYGLRFGPDPSTHNRCTIGGMIGNNACGSRALGYGRTSDNIVSLDAITIGGERFTAVSGAPFGGGRTLKALRKVVNGNLATIRTELGRFGRQVSGYSLEHLLPERGFDLARMLAGTEGTLAVLLGATVKLVRSPAVTALVALGYDDMASAADAVPALLPFGPIAVEGLDRRIVDVLIARRGPGAVPPLPRGNGWLFVELGGARAGEVASTSEALIAAAGALEARVVTNPAEAEALWRIREDGAGLAARPLGGRRAYSGWEDAAVPPEKLGGYLREFDALMGGHGLSGVPYGHFGDGCVHVRIDFPLDRPNGTEVFRSFLLDAAALVARYGGSMSGEHGDGRARGELLPLMYSPKAIAAFEAVKRVFDPLDLLNPGVIVRPAAVDADLRTPAAKPVRELLGFAYHDDAGDFTGAVHRCTGVGKCRADTTGAGGVMCPSYLATRDEKDSTRGRSRVLQEMVNGSLVRDGWRSPEVREALDLCLACKGCASDCPTGVDMATYKAEALYQAYRRRPRPISHYTLGWLPRWSRIAALAPWAANAALHGPLSTVGMRAAGLDSRREPPRFTDHTFRAWFRRHRRRTGDPVLLWVDTFTNHFAPHVGIAAVKVLERAGYSVSIPKRSLCCGLTWITTGQLDGARRILGRSLAALAPAAADGVPIVGLEPSCTAVFRGDAAELMRGEDATRAVTVAKATRTLAELLTERGAALPDLRGVRAVAQPHCHHHAVMGWSADRELLARAGVETESVGGCCGLAGNFGVERGHYDVSVAVAENALLPAVRAAEEDTVILADGFSCRTQLDHLSARSGRHLAELLADPPRARARH